MDAAATRTLTAQLADDLGWLEEHCRQQPDLAAHAGQLRLAAALTRNVLGPYPRRPAAARRCTSPSSAGPARARAPSSTSSPAPSAAEANPQAGFTRHPIAYTSAPAPSTGPRHVGFLGPLHASASQAPPTLDEDVYQVRRVPAEPGRASCSSDFVVWDCPDMTTWAADRLCPPAARGRRAGRRDRLRRLRRALQRRGADAVPQAAAQGGQAGRRRADEDARGGRPGAGRPLPQGGPRPAAGGRTVAVLPIAVPDCRRSWPTPHGGAARVPHPAAEPGRRPGRRARSRGGRSAASAMPRLPRDGQRADSSSVARDDVAALEAWQDVVQRRPGRVRRPLPPRVPDEREVPPLRRGAGPAHGAAGTAGGGQVRQRDALGGADAVPAARGDEQGAGAARQAVDARSRVLEAACRLARPAAGGGACGDAGQHALW